MDKEQIYKDLKATGQIHRPSKSPIWKQAFALYMRETGDTVSTGCNKCFDKVRKWLKK